ncbi:unnamed protein product [Caretta caretta]
MDSRLSDEPREETSLAGAMPPEDPRDPKAPWSMSEGEWVGSSPEDLDFSLIPLTPASQEKTAFPIPFGLYQFTMIPFGLQGAAATFQRLMNQILSPHNSYATAYVDNFVIYSASWKEHLQHLASVLQALGNTGLTANLAKCHLGQREVTYLGYTMGREKLCLLVDKVQAYPHDEEESTAIFRSGRVFRTVCGQLCHAHHPTDGRDGSSAAWGMCQTGRWHSPF